MPGPIWVIDSSSLIQIKSTVPVSRRADVFDALSKLVREGRLRMPKQVVEELRRYADDAMRWAVEQEPVACVDLPSHERVKETLAAVPDVLDPDKDSGPDEADPYVLSMALVLKDTGLDARVVTEEVKTDRGKSR